MSVKFLDQFDISVDTEDPMDLSLAIATRGVVEASSMSAGEVADSGKWAEAIDKAVRRDSLTPWRLPSAASKLSHSHPEGMSAQALAHAWRDVAFGARLVVEPGDDDSLGSVLSAAKALSKSVVRSGIHGDWPGISSVVVPYTAQSQSEGKWPLNVGILPSEYSTNISAQIRRASMFRRDLAQVSLVRPGGEPYDLLIAPFPLAELPGRMASMGLAAKAGAIATTGQMGFGAASRNALLYLYREMGVGFVATGFPVGGLEGYWTNEVVRALSHGSTLDTAMWEADYMSRRNIAGSSAKQLPPLMIVADKDFLGRSSLNHLVQDLAGRIERLDMGKTIDIGVDAAESLSLQLGPQIPSVVADSLRANAKDLSFLRESDGATGLSELSQTVAATEAVEAKSPSPPSLTPPLHADAVFVEAPTGKRVDDTKEALRQGFQYMLRVGLRHVPTGISHRGQPAQPLAPLPNDAEIKLLVAINDPDEYFALGDTVQVLKIPANLTSDSLQDVEFRATPLRDTPNKEQLASIEVRIFFELNLIEYLKINAEVVRRSAPTTEPLLGLDVPIFIEQSQSVGRSYQDIARGLQPRQLSIDVQQATHTLRFTFTVRTGEGDTSRELNMHAGSDVSLKDVTRSLTRIRQLWEDIAVERFASGQAISGPAFKRTLYELARAGDSLWSLLFRGVQDSSIWQVGEWLREHPAVAGSLVDVHLLDGATEFVFPWSMLYDRLPPNDLVSDIDPDGFWGLRYCVELTTSNWHSATDAALVLPVGGARMDFMWWESFSNAQEQKDLLQQLATSSSGRLAVSDPIDSKPAFYSRVKNCDADILYFYTHGYTKPPEADAGYNELMRIRQHYEGLPEADRQASGMQAMYELLSAPDFEVTDSWVALTYGRLQLADMRRTEMNLAKAPIVFLNMCQSAQILPGLSESFVRLFLERKARSVLGTECPMTTTFAHPFSAYLLEQFFGGLTLGEALRRARCHFMQQQNPLGLAYSLYGAANARFDPPLVVSPPLAAPSPSQPTVAAQPEGA